MMDTNQRSTTSPNGTNIDDFFRTCLQILVQKVMDIEVSQMLEADRYERNDTRRAYRNGYRNTMWNTPFGDIQLRIPKLRRGSYYPDRLLNDEHVIKSLITLLQRCVYDRVATQSIIKTFADLHLLHLSPYEAHQIVDELNPLFDGIQKSVHRSIRSSYSHVTLVQQRSTDGDLRLINRDELIQPDQDFWRDFARRMLHAGLSVKDPQSVLSEVNPYAVISIQPMDDKWVSIQYLSPRYVNENLLIA